MTPRYPWWLLVLVLPFAWLRGPNRVFLVQAASSYVASIARVVSWMIVIAIVARRGGADELAILMLLRGTVGLLSYAGLGITPGLVHMLARPVPVIGEVQDSGTIEYARRIPESAYASPKHVYATAWLVSLAAGVVALFVAFGYAANLSRFHNLHAAPEGSAPQIVALFLAGAVVVRMVSDVMGARLQSRGRLFADSVCLCIAEGTFVLVAIESQTGSAETAAIGLLIGSAVLLVARRFACIGEPSMALGDFDSRLVRPLLVGGGFVLLSQLADWLYAPANQVLIDRFLRTRDIATYVPAIQVDAALLLLVAGLSTVLLPRAAMAFHLKDADTLRGYYLTGTIFSIAILAFGATFVCLASDWLFRVWFKDPLPATQAILPLVMTHTVIGGSASIGRSVLFGMGRIKPYAIAAIVGGVANVVLAVLFLTTTDLGLRGIIYATILTVTVRCLIWLPWYTMRQIGKCVATREGQ